VTKAKIVEIPMTAWPVACPDPVPSLIPVVANAEPGAHRKARKLSRRPKELHGPAAGVVEHLLSVAHSIYGAVQWMSVGGFAIVRGVAGNTSPSELI
jgi:hypothetical protein